MKSTRTEHTAPLLKNRIIGFDLARAIAILAMILVNYHLTVVEAFPNATEAFTIFSFINGLLSGRAAATFVILAGIGTSLMARSIQDGAPSRAVRVRLIKRALFLLVVGYAWLPLWVGDILHFYGLFLIVGAFCLTLRNRSLVLFIAVALIGNILYLLLDGSLGTIAEFAVISYRDYSLGFIVSDLLVNGLHPFFPWYALYLYGMLLGRIALTHKQQTNRLVIVAAVTLVISELIGIIAVGKFPDPYTLADIGRIVLLSAYPVPATPTYILASASTATLIIIACVRIGIRFSDTLLVRWLASTGQLSLSIYIAHFFFGLIPLVILLEVTQVSGITPFVWAFVFACGFFCVAVLASARWRRRYKFGPLEKLMRLVSR